MRFDDVHWKNFGREEGLFSGRLIEKICERRVWSLRRITVAILILPVFTLFAALKLLAFGGGHIFLRTSTGSYRELVGRLMHEDPV
ncbi:MAG TPA: hypothetical protein VF753_11970, partial [Terriglobales bacterium]